MSPTDTCPNVVVPTLFHIHLSNPTIVVGRMRAQLQPGLAIRSLWVTATPLRAETNEMSAIFYL